MRLCSYITLMMAFAVAFSSWLPAAELVPATTSLSRSDSDFLPVEEAFRFTTEMDDEMLRLYWTVTPGHYLYRHTFAVTAGGEPVELVGLPHGTPTHDEYFGDVEVFRESVVIEISRRQFWGFKTIDVHFQGCAEAGFCYPPQKKQLNVTKM